jgi:hypothetical protein
MRNKAGYVAALLVLSSVLLGILVPGGPIETRSFSHIAPLILGAFNTFLTILGIGSLAIAYFAAKRRRWAFALASICGIFYFLVYALDLAKVFPVSPDEMPTVLFAIEVAGIIVSLLLTYLSLNSRHIALSDNAEHAVSVEMRKAHILLLVLMVLTGIGIIIFSTMSAMGG